MRIKGFGQSPTARKQGLPTVHLIATNGERDWTLCGQDATGWTAPGDDQVQGGCRSCAKHYSPAALAAARQAIVAAMNGEACRTVPAAPAPVNLPAKEEAIRKWLSLDRCDRQTQLFCHLARDLEHESAALEQYVHTGMPAEVVREHLELHRAWQRALAQAQALRGELDDCKFHEVIAALSAAAGAVATGLTSLALGAVASAPEVTTAALSTLSAIA